jgi:hypothetical protein
VKNATAKFTPMAIQLGVIYNVFVTEEKSI